MSIQAAAGKTTDKKEIKDFGFAVNKVISDESKLPALNLKPVTDQSVTINAGITTITAL